MIRKIDAIYQGFSYVSIQYDHLTQLLINDTSIEVKKKRI